MNQLALLNEQLYLLIACGLVVLCLLGWGWRRYTMRHILTKWREDRADLEDALSDVDIPVSVIVISRGDGYIVERNLPAVLTQQRVSMEVIVVDADSQEMESVRTADALKRLKAKFPQLRQTYVPPTGGHHHPEVLAAMLGARAARYETLLFVPPTFEPDSEDWLLDLLQYVDASVQALVDYARVDAEGEESFWVRRRQRKRMMKAAKKCTIDTAGGSMMVQKDWFLRGLNGESEAGEWVFLYTDRYAGCRDVVRAEVYSTGSKSSLG